MQYEAVFFDLDGTLLDTSVGVFRAIDYTIETFHLSPLSIKEKQSFIGPPIQKSFQEHYKCSPERAWELASTWREAYKEKYLLEAVPYDGIYDLLQCLRQRGIKTGVATNKREDYMLMLLEHFSFTSLFDCIVGSDFEGKRDKADIIRLCMDRINLLESRQCIMVGDTIGDWTAAQKVGTAFLGVSYGFGFKKDNGIKEMILVNSCSEIKKLLCP